MMHRHLELAVHPRSASVARRLLADMLSKSQLEDDWADAAAIAVSEMVTNAVVHAGGPITLDVRIAGEGVRVEVTDGSPRVPVARRYAVTSGTGRGLRMLDSVVSRWGVTPRDDGKASWFELGEPVASPLDAGPHPPPAAREDATVSVRLRNVPLLMHWAWQEHAQALLREYLLFALETQPEVIDQHAEAGSALDLLREHIPAPQLPDDPAEILADALEPRVSVDELELPVPVDAVPHFATLNLLLGRASVAASARLFLGPPTQPEISELRDWLCDEVAAQASGSDEPRPWAPRTGVLEALADESALQDRYRDLLDQDQALLAVDEASIIVAVTPSIVGFLGYAEADELLGRRVIAIVPGRFHQAHIAGTTLNATNGRDVLLGTAVSVPVLRADGSEADVELFVTSCHLGPHRRGFLCRFALPDAAPPALPDAGHEATA